MSYDRDFSYSVLGGVELANLASVAVDRWSACKNAAIILSILAAVDGAAMRGMDVIHEILLNLRSGDQRKTLKDSTIISSVEAMPFP